MPSASHANDEGRRSATPVTVRPAPARLRSARSLDLAHAELDSFETEADRVFSVAFARQQWVLALPS